MEYQIVPARKAEVTKPKKKSTKQKITKCDEELNDVFTLQPIFKPPKSTLDLEKPTDKIGNDTSLSMKKNLERSKTDAGFNHFTMSRPGTLKSPETFPGYKDQSSQSNGKRATKTAHYRRASSGEELIHAAAARRQNRKSLTYKEISNLNGFLGAGGSKSLASSPRPQLVQDLQRRKSAGCKLTASQDNKESDTQFYEQAQRRKSLFDSHALTKWYSPERRPMSTERVERSRSNVISPRTLTKLYQTFRQQNGDDGVGGLQLSVCTEDDWKLYGSIFPNRKLVSHKQLHKGQSLPYNDNIGLEETVTQDQARKMGKMQQYNEWKKQQQKPSHQTPKQVWYRTVRSVLAVNQLYHKVQRQRPHNEQFTQKIKV